MYYRASCNEKMEMRELALSNFGEAIKKYPKSSMVSLAELGIMRVAYRNNDRSRVLEQYRRLSRGDVQDSVLHHAAYIAGQTLVNSGDAKQAVRVFSTVPETHPDYVFALHSKGVAQVLSMETNEAFETFEKCIVAQIKTPAQKEIYNRSCLLLGYLFYKEESLSKAVSALRMVSPDSYYYEDALLGLGWCAAKAQQWNDCISTGTMLAKATSKPVLKYEASLIKAYGFLMNKNYPGVRGELGPVVEHIGDIKAPSQDSLRIEQAENTARQSAYSVLAKDAEDLSLMQESSIAVKKIDSLHIFQQKAFTELNGFKKHEDEFGRLSFFSRDINKLREDIEYMLAVAENLDGMAGKTKVMEKLKEKTEGINQEIEKINEEMEKIEGTK
jgi:tetratricopeptide (TPR) repeat protein